jgi:hypothetical protein
MWVVNPELIFLNPVTGFLFLPLAFLSPSTAKHGAPLHKAGLIIEV